MKGAKLFLAVLFCTVLRLCHSGTVTKTKIKTDIGGGSCVSDEDCSNNGACDPVEGKGNADSGKGKCDCKVNFSGQYCEKETKMKLGPVLPTTEDKSKAPKKGKKRGRIHKTSNDAEMAARKTLKYDEGSNVFGLAPSVLAKAKQPFLIYCPHKENFLFVSYDVEATGRRTVYVEARKDRLGERNQFLLEEVPGQKDKFFIYNVDQKKYLYVSNSKSGIFKYFNYNLLAADKIGEGTDKNKYIFEFKDDDDDGFYEIINDGKGIYVSAHKLGIPLYPLVKATDQKELQRWDSRFFQLSLKKNAKDIKFEVEGKAEPDVSDGPETLIQGSAVEKMCHGGKESDNPKEETSTFTDEITETITYTKTHGFTVKGDLKATFGIVSFTYTYSKQEQEAHAQKVVAERAAKIIIKPNQCACVKKTFQRVSYKRNYVLKATTAEGKQIEGQGQITGLRNFKYESRSDIIDDKPGAKCPHEV